MHVRDLTVVLSVLTFALFGVAAARVPRLALVPLAAGLYWLTGLLQSWRPYSFKRFIILNDLQPLGFFWLPALLLLLAACLLVLLMRHVERRVPY